MIPPATPKVGPLATAALVPDVVLAAACEFVAVGPDDVVVVGATIIKVRLSMSSLVQWAHLLTPWFCDRKLLGLCYNAGIRLFVSEKVDLVLCTHRSHEVWERVWIIRCLNRIGDSQLTWRRGRVVYQDNLEWVRICVYRAPLDSIGLGKVEFVVEGRFGDLES